MTPATTTTALANRLPDLRPLALVVILYLVAILVVSPHGDFPLNDDWVYGEGARIFMQTGRVEIPTSCSPCVVHVISGGIVGKLVGFSYSALRVLTLFIGFGGFVALYFLLREIGTTRKLSLFLTLAYVFNPLVLSLSFTFMTDVAAMSLLNAYLLFTFRGVKRDSAKYFLAAAIMLVCAIGVRQGSVMFVAGNVVVLAFYWLARRHSWVLLLGLVVAPIAAMVAADAWLQSSDRLSDAYVVFWKLHHDTIHDFMRRPGQGLFSMTVACGQVLCYLGLYCVPALVSFVPLFADMFKHKPRVPAWTFVLAATTMCTALTKVVGDDRLMPFNQNMLRVPQVGPPNLMGISIPLLKAGQRRLLTGAAGVTAFLLLTVLAAGLQRMLVICGRVVRGLIARRGTRAPTGYRFARAVLSAHCFLCLLATLAAVSFETVVMDVDRHYLTAFVPVLLCIALTQRWLRLKPLYWLAVPALVLMIVYSTCAAQDYMSWNRARWAAAWALEARGISPASIDGGAEYNFSRDLNLWVKTFKMEDPGDAPQAKWRWWRVNDDEYILSFSTIPNYDVVDRHEYFSALAMRRLEVLTLHRAIPASTPRAASSNHD